MTSMLSAATSSGESYRERIKEFLEHWSAPTKQKHFRCLHFVLVHCSETGNSPMTSDAVDVKADEQQRAAALERIAQSFYDAALVTAAHFPAPQLFSVAGYPKSGETTPPIAQYPFRLAPPKEALAGFQSSEPATEKGALAFAMRLAETATRMAFDNLQRGQDRMERMIDAAHERNKVLEEQSITRRASLEDSLDRSELRKLQVYAGTLSVNRTERAWQAFEKLVPRILDKWGAGPLGDFAKSLQPAQVFTLMQTLSPEQRRMALEGLDIHDLQPELRKLLEVPAQASPNGSSVVVEVKGSNGSGSNGGPPA